MGLFEYGCTDPGCSKCVGEGFNPGGGWMGDAPFVFSPQQPMKKRKKAKGKGKKSRAKATR